MKKYVENLRDLAERDDIKHDEAERDEACSIDVWNEQVWCLLVTQVTIHADGSAEFLFRGENHITVN